MATVKARLRPSIIEGGTGTIYYQVTHRRTVRQITTDIRIPPEYWDAERQRIVSSVHNSSTIQARIDRGILLLQSVIGALEASGSEYTVENVVELYRTGGNRVFILSFMQEQIDGLRRCDKYGTAKNYEHTMHSFARFLGYDIPLAAISEQLIDNYNAFLVQRGIVRNSVSFYMRVLRAVYNKAVRRHLVEQTNPFRNVYTGIDKTRKRAIDEKMPCNNILSVLGVDTHFLHPFFGYLCHKAVAFLVIGKRCCIFREERGGDMFDWFSKTMQFTFGIGYTELRLKEVDNCRVVNKQNPV